MLRVSVSAAGSSAGQYRDETGESHMNMFTLGDLKLGLDDLFGKRQPMLRTSQIGRVYEPLLKAKRDALEALPPALTTDRALSDRLAHADARHDAFGRTIWNVTETVLSLPEATPAHQAAVARIRQAFLPGGLMDLQVSFASEAENARQRRKDLAAREADLRSFAVPGAQTLYEVAAAFLDGGDALSQLLSERAGLETVDPATQNQAKHLRPSTIGLLGRLRAGVKDEVAGYPDLPRDLEGQIFGFFDNLHASRVHAASAAAARAAAAKGGAKTAGA